MDKLEVARRQLGTALWLFLDDVDHVSVQCLACGAGEVLDVLVDHDGGEPLSRHIMRTSGIDFAELKRLRNLYWNAFKHATTREGGLREDRDTLDFFADQRNDAPLMIAWSDYQRLVGALPIAAQIFLSWYFALNEEKLAPCVDVQPYRDAFPGIQDKDRSEQKAALRRSVATWQDDTILLAGPATEPFLLIP